MSDIAIRAEKLSKQYRLDGQQVRSYHRTLRDAVANTVAASFRTLRRGAAHTARAARGETFWALRDVSFEIKRGEVVGFIGRNGAGKSTLLKILSRITEPTSGSADLTGRIGSLLEVGTGFHPELSGRENIYLNGAILGMSRADIRRKFDEMVEFAEVSTFVDMPVKHYSSGMYLRLAFSVAAHMEPDILLVDEVLAVGDAAFQKKCLGKMHDVSEQGRTVLFVSHNMSVIIELCQQGVLLDAGRLVHQGSPSECVARYLNGRDRLPALQGASDVLALGPVSIKGRASRVSSGEPFTVRIPIAARGVKNARMFFVLEDYNGQKLVHQRVHGREIGAETLDGECVLEVEMPPLWLSSGVYTAYFKFFTSSLPHASGKLLSDPLMFEVQNAEALDGASYSTGKNATILSPHITWRVSSGHARATAGERLSA